MGTSTDAILFYGFTIPGGENDEDEGLCFWKQIDPDSDEDYPESDPEDDTEPEDFIALKFGLDAKYLQTGRHDKLLDKIGVSVVTHCSYESPMYALAITNSVMHASRGFPVEIKDLKTDARTWKKLFKDFCAKTGAQYKEPCWILCSRWS